MYSIQDDSILHHDTMAAQGQRVKYMEFVFKNHCTVNTSFCMTVPITLYGMLTLELTLINNITIKQNNNQVGLLYIRISEFGWHNYQYATRIQTMARYGLKRGGRTTNSRHHS